MARTLYRTASRGPISHRGDEPWSSSAAVFPLAGGNVVVHRGTGAWAFFEPDEAVDIASAPPTGPAGALLARLGLVGQPAAPVATVGFEPPEGFHFFEFAVSTGCNLACSYCFIDAPSRRGGAMATPALAELFIDRIAEYRAATRAKQLFVVEFTGGEPLLNFDVIRHTIDYAHRTYGGLLNVQYCLQTNLTPMTEQRLEYLAANRVNIGISCDGYAALHDLQRLSRTGRCTHAAVERRIAMVMSRHPEAVGGVISVVGDAGLDKLSELMLYLYLLGFRSVALRPVQAVGRGWSTAAGSDRADRFMRALLNTLVRVIEPLFARDGTLLHERTLALTFRNLLGPDREFMCERSPCGAARNISVLAPDGAVYSCNQACGDQRFRLGDLYRQSFQELARSAAAQELARRTIHAIPACSNCAFASWCGSPCPLGALWATGDIMSRSAECAEMRGRYGLALEALITGRLDLDVVARLSRLPAPLDWTTA